MIRAPLRYLAPLTFVLFAFGAGCDDDDASIDGGTSSQDATTDMNGDASTGTDGSTLADAGLGDASSMGGDATTGTDGSTDGGTTGDGGSALRMEIRDFTFSPSILTVPAGATVQVDNLDTAPHSVTSMSTIDAFVFGAVNGVAFDTGPFMGTNFFSIPANAPVGTVVPCFCSVHLGAMRNTCQVTIGPAQ